MLWLRGGVVILGIPTSSKPMSFKDVVKTRSSIPNSSQHFLITSAYIVEHDEEAPYVEMTLLEVAHLHSIYKMWLFAYLMCFGLLHQVYISGSTRLR